MPDEPSISNLSWTAENVTASLNTLREYVEAEAARQMQWYYDKMIWKSRMSVAMRVVSIVCFTLGGLVPIFKGALRPGTGFSGSFDLGQLGYLLIGIGAGCIGFDRFFGYSSGWMRYITTAFAIGKSLEEFRFDWAARMARVAGHIPVTDEVLQLIEVSKQFSLAVKGQVDQETKAWVAEFQSNLAQLEKDLKERAETAKSESKVQAEAVQPGGISITVANGSAADGGFSVELDGQTVERGVVGNTAEVYPVSPGMHQLVVTATLARAPARASDLVKVSAGEVTKVSVELRGQATQPLNSPP